MVFENDAATAIRTSIPPPQLLDHLYTTINMKSFCITEKGALGISLGEPRAGDRIFVARGATCPLVLRPVFSSRRTTDRTGHKSTRKRDVIKRLFGGRKTEALFNGDRYTLIGGAFFEGIMDGEVIDMKERKNVWDDVVYLV